MNTEIFSRRRHHLIVEEARCVENAPSFLEAQSPAIAQARNPASGSVINNLDRDMMVHGTAHPSIHSAFPSAGVGEWFPMGFQ